MSENLNKLKKLLKDMFQLEQADLDFGIYRIMNQKREEITNFMENDLLSKVKEAFLNYKTEDTKNKLDELNRFKNQLLYRSISPETSQEYIDLKNQIESGLDELEIENEVFSHLVNFFSRYYKDGDFLSLRRYKHNTYAIPYDGEEVKLYWANSDQYYIKTTENFKDYCFKTDDGKRVHFKLVEASTENDNNKPQKDERKFILCEENFIEIEEDELIIKFEYKPSSEKREKLNNATFEKLKEKITLQNQYKEFYGIFALKPTEKDKSRTLVEKHLNDYTAKNAFDYFIHKDLGGFLRRELDFYIKNEVIFIDDWGTDKEVFISMAKVKVIKDIAENIIRFLEQLENFQKKLWLKKKFITETNYCLTVDKVPEFLYGEIINNNSQIDEWKALFAIDEIEGFNGTVTEGFLKENPFLVIDTANFSRDFMESIVSSFENLDEELNGLLIHSENFQALNLLQDRYREKIDCIYIDPPYNTGNDDNFCYKDNYQNSTWLSLMNDRILKASFLMSDSCPFFCSIDNDEWYELRMLLEKIWGKDKYVNEIFWQKLTAAKKQSNYFSNLYEKIIIFRKNLYMKLNKVYIDSQKDDLNYPYTEENTGRRYGSFDFTQDGQGEGRYFGNDFLLPPEGKHWIWGQEKINEGVKNEIIIFTKNGTPRVKRYLDEKEGNAVGDFWIDTEIRPLSSNDSERIGFNTQKPLCLLKRIINASKNTIEYCILDYFAGSGTTGHAVINLNREDEGNRKYILVEMGEYFNTVTKPRIQKIIYSKDWKDGKPVSREGSSHIFKYIRIESYEDTLNNLEIKRNDNIQMSLNNFKQFREDYMLSYMIDIEIRESDSLLNIDKFKDPFSYKLKIERNNETRYVAIDLIETFNYLIGLTVKRIEKTSKFNLKADSKKLEKDANGKYSFKEIEGILPSGEKALIIWRKLTDDINLDNAALLGYFTKKDYNPLDFEYDYIFVNGDNNLQNIKVSEERWKVVFIEEEFKKRMFDTKEI